MFILKCIAIVDFLICTDAVQLLPLMSDPEFLPVLHRELYASNSKPWECEGLQAITFLAWGLVLATIRSHHSQPTQGTPILNSFYCVICDENVLTLNIILGISRHARRR